MHVLKCSQLMEQKKLNKQNEKNNCYFHFSRGTHELNLTNKKKFLYLCFHNGTEANLHLQG